ncbi:ester cyclase [Hyalangium versicolor]|uniref:ester cyclase n=1 Tax=Hyalangium versicolor TaxID=2861190 RepID=UPI001CCD2E99|nr:ester cyclase [Hyalangium versicolor]
MTPAQNKALVARLFEELINERNTSRVHEFLAPDFERHDIGQLFPDRSGAESTKEHVAMLFTGIPDLRMDVLDLVAEGDRVCARYVAYGTHTGELLGRPGSGKPVRWEGINIYRFVDGKIVETWQLGDGMRLLQQIGALQS